MALHVGHNCVPWGDCDVCGAKVEPQYRQRTEREKGDTMTKRVSGFVVTLEQDMREDDAQEIVRAILLLKGVVNVDAIGSAPLDQHTIQRRLQAKMLHAVATAFEEPRHLSTHGDK
jgi:hypothetical protein